MSNDNCTIAFKVEGLTCRVGCLPGNNYQSLHLKLEPDAQMSQHWTPDLIAILEKFFETRVAAPPFRPNAMTAFIKIIQCPIEPLKDILNIMRYEMMPEMVAANNYKWTCRLCLTVPPSAPPIIPLGQPGLLRLKEKMLLFLHIIRANVTLPPDKEPQSVVIPLVYDITLNQTTVAQKEMNTVISIAQQHLARLMRSGQIMMNRCTILPSVQDLLFNLTLPNEGPPHQPSMNSQNNQQQGGGGGPTGQFPGNQGPMGGPMGAGGPQPGGMMPIGGGPGVPQRMMTPNRMMGGPMGGMPGGPGQGGPGQGGPTGGGGGGQFMPS